MAVAASAQQIRETLHPPQRLTPARWMRGPAELRRRIVSAAHQFTHGAFVVVTARAVDDLILWVSSYDTFSDAQAAAAEQDTDPRVTTRSYIVSGDGAEVTVTDRHGTPIEPR